MPHPCDHQGRCAGFEGLLGLRAASSRLGNPIRHWSVTSGFEWTPGRVWSCRRSSAPQAKSHVSTSKPAALEMMTVKKFPSCCAPTVAHCRPVLPHVTQGRHMDTLCLPGAPPNSFLCLINGYLSSFTTLINWNKMPAS